MNYFPNPFGIFSLKTGLDIKQNQMSWPNIYARLCLWGIYNTIQISSQDSMSTKGVVILFNKTTFFIYNLKIYHKISRIKRAENKVQFHIIVIVHE